MYNHVFQFEVPSHQESDECREYLLAPGYQKPQLQ